MAEQPPLLPSIAYAHTYQNIDIHMNTHSVKQKNKTK